MAREQHTCVVISCDGCATPIEDKAVRACALSGHMQTPVGAYTCPGRGETLRMEEN